MVKNERQKLSAATITIHKKTGKVGKGGRMRKNPFNKIIDQIKAIIVIKFIN